MRNFTKQIVSTLALTLAISVPAFAAEIVDLDDLLAKVKQGRVNDAAQAEERLDGFRKNRADQKYDCKY